MKKQQEKIRIEVEEEGHANTFALQDDGLTRI
jgi:hypothetical protein